jgi:hypothetical protein
VQVDKDARRRMPSEVMKGAELVSQTTQAVEKVVVGPVGGPKEARNKAKTLQKRSL